MTEAASIRARLPRRWPWRSLIALNPSRSTNNTARLVPVRRDEAMAALAKAIEVRPEVAEGARGDSDLESLKDDPEFRALIAD